jgi:putative transposon-encoded protein
MKDEAELPTSVHVDDVEKVLIKWVKRLGNTGYPSVHKRYIWKNIIVILTKTRISGRGKSFTDSFDSEVLAGFQIIAS